MPGRPASPEDFLTHERSGRTIVFRRTECEEKGTPHSLLKRGADEIEFHVECVASSRKIFFELTCGLDQHWVAVVFGHDSQAHPLGFIISPQDRCESIVIAVKYEPADR